MSLRVLCGSKMSLEVVLFFVRVGYRLSGAYVSRIAKVKPIIKTMENQNIVCFAKDWSEDPTSCNHVLMELSKTNKVLWLNSISTRSPNLASGRDMGKIFKKLAGFLKGPQKVGKQMWVYTPIVLPFHHIPAAVAFNRLWLRMTIFLLTFFLGMRNFQLWTFVPTSAEYVGHMGEDLLVYYCTDNWSSFSSVDGAKIGNMVDRLAKQADIVFATSTPLVEKLRPNNPETHLAAHGVNHRLFSRAVEESASTPEDMLTIPRPTLGFYGLIEDWLDQNLLIYLAKRHPEWSIVLVGRTCVDVSKLQALPNVHFLGRKPHAELPLYCKGFSVGLIPHQVNELTHHMNPIKLREYLSAGLPVVSTALPEVRQYGKHCLIAETYEEFERDIEMILATDTPQARRERSEAMAWETWENKVADLSRKVERVQDRKKSGGAKLKITQPDI